MHNLLTQEENNVWFLIYFTHKNLNYVVHRNIIHGSLWFERFCSNTFFNFLVNVVQQCFLSESPHMSCQCQDWSNSDWERSISEIRFNFLGCESLGCAEKTMQRFISPLICRKYWRKSKMVWMTVSCLQTINIHVHRVFDGSYYPLLAQKHLLKIKYHVWTF